VDVLIKLTLFSLVFLFIFAWFREQVCIIACPYGRLQGALLDKQSIVVAYDYVRGEGTEGRHKIHKDENRKEKGYGDCIDCKQCVLVCPTGIDIRNGTQLECINCTACIDACDAIMDKTEQDRGLIRYASEDNIAEGEKFKFSARIISYIVVLGVLLTVLITLLFSRNDVEATVLRLPGQMYKTVGDSIQNVYSIKIINKTNDEYDNLKIKMIDHKGSVKVIGGQVNVPKLGMDEKTLFITISKKDIGSSKEKIKIGIYKNGELIESDKTNFPAPMKIR
jgi:cytochrome c oxidase accessory protein FixG